MKYKTWIIILTILFVLSGACAITGYVYSKKESKNPNIDNNITKEKITYEYYLEDVLQEIMPLNQRSITTNEDNQLPPEENNTQNEENNNETIEDQYAFSKYVCSNNLTGKFDSENWKFIPDQNIESTCKLYFVKTHYDVVFTVVNGVVDSENILQIEREKDGIFKIVPNEGYHNPTIECSNNKAAIWDESTNTISISAIMSDVACKVNFNVKELKMNVVVKNGIGTTTELAKYGDSISAIIEPNEGYENPKITCTNNQEAVYENNKITIAKITDSTDCNVVFNKIPIVQYTLKITNPTEFENISIISGSSEQSITSGKDGKVILKSTDGTTPKLTCGNIIGETTNNEDGSVTYTFLNVTSDITCQISN